MADIWRNLLSQQWLCGGLLAVAGAVLAVLGLTLQKAAQYQLATASSAGREPAQVSYTVPPWHQIRRMPLFWVGFSLYFLGCPVSVAALCYAPETTVVPLGAIKLLINFVLAYGLLNERFTKRDITATTVCILTAILMNACVPRNTPSFMEDFPYLEALHFIEGLTSNVGFAAYLLSWSALFATSLLLLFSIKESKPLALPLLVALLSSQWQFMMKIAGTLVIRGHFHPEIWTNPLTYRLLVAVIALFALCIYVGCEGQRYLAARFFMPASFAPYYAFTIIQDLLFFREWQDMTYVDLCVFVVAALVSSCAVYFISPEHNLIRDPDHSPLNTPLLGPSDDILASHHDVLQIMDEYRFQKAQPKDVAALEVEDMTVPFRGLWALLPIVLIGVAISVPMLLWQTEYVFAAFCVLTTYAAYNGWKMGLHIAVFSYVGVKKVKHYENADFHAIYDAQRKDKKKALATWPRWEDVVHFVILPNYKEDIEVLRLAIESIARSQIASSQICLVLAMEAREDGAKDKADALQREFHSRFWHCMSTYHPPGLPGETPGKSSNTRWAADRIIDDFIPRRKENTDHCVFTVADADSEFHAEYFSALTYHFVYAGGAEGATPDRYLTIWQPPILHYKNYIKQPAIVRLASFITSQHELANLADPNSTRVPYSTYSISARLAQAVNGWDPDWISEDWHMALKCFMATAGRLRITPIFLPVLNYAPEGDSFVETLKARWTQAKRHALGFSELVYFHDHFPRILHAVHGHRGKISFLWRSFFLWFKLLMIHLVLATFWAVGPFNAVLIAWFIKHEKPQDLNINSWTFLINCVCQVASFLSFISLFLVSVNVYEAVKGRVSGSDDPSLSIRWRSPLVHSLAVLLESFFCLPFFFAIAAAAEWVAAVKTACTHKFEYEVALKPNLSKDAARAEPSTSSTA